MDQACPAKECLLEHGGHLWKPAFARWSANSIFVSRCNGPSSAAILPPAVGTPPRRASRTSRAEARNLDEEISMTSFKTSLAIAALTLCLAGGSAFAQT